MQADGNIFQQVNGDHMSKLSLIGTHVDGRLRTSRPLPRFGIKTRRGLKRQITGGRLSAMLNHLETSGLIVGSQ
jgi:hypothetical protein